MTARPHKLLRTPQVGTTILQRRILDGLSWTGTDPWLASEIALALGVAQLSVRRVCDALAEEGRVVVVSRDPYTVRRP